MTLSFVISAFFVFAYVVNVETDTIINRKKNKTDEVPSIDSYYKRMRDIFIV